jgi:hypothetical protein
MARQTVINLSDTINTFRVKSNTIAAHIGDLDDLSSDYAGHDSSIVKALNFSKAVLMETLLEIQVEHFQ